MTNGSPAAPPEKPPAHGHVMRTLRNNFLTGVVVAAPVAVTIWLVLGFVGLVDRIVKPLIPPVYNPETYLKFAVPGLGVVFAVMFLTGLGAFAANVAGRAALGWGDRLVDRVPIVRTVYRGTKQIISSIMVQRESTFREVVMIQHPREDCWMVGFVTRPASGDVARALGPDFVAVFVPTTPNPTTGFLIYERRSRLKTLNMSVEDGLKLIVSAGLLTPGDQSPQV